jgi:hypothetical protein
MSAIETSAAAAPLACGNIEQRPPHLSEANRVFGDKVMVDGIGPDQRSQKRAQQERIRARANGEMQIGHRCGL